MDENLKKIIPFAKKYKFNVVWNVIHNVMYALFGTLGMVLIFPVLEVLFKNEEKITELPKYEGILEIGSYAKQYLFFYVFGILCAYGGYRDLLVAAIAGFQCGSRAGSRRFFAGGPYCPAACRPFHCAHWQATYDAVGVAVL